MKILLSQVEGGFESKGSKFLSFLTPFSNFEALSLTLRTKHPKAVHFVSASRYFDEYHTYICNKLEKLLENKIEQLGKTEILLQREFWYVLIFINCPYISGTLKTNMETMVRALIKTSATDFSSRTINLICEFLLQKTSNLFYYLNNIKTNAQLNCMEVWIPNSFCVYIPYILCRHWCKPQKLQQSHFADTPKSACIWFVNNVKYSSDTSARNGGAYLGSTNQH